MNQGQDENPITGDLADQSIGPDQEFADYSVCKLGHDLSAFSELSQRCGGLLDLLNESGCIVD